MQTMEDFDSSEATSMAWCANCDGPVDVDDTGQCIECRDNGERQDVERIVHEPVPATSPRSIECELCGADIGKYCHEGEDGSGYNHAARVEEHDADGHRSRG